MTPARSWVFLGDSFSAPLAATPDSGSFSLLHCLRGSSQSSLDQPFDRQLVRCQLRPHSGCRRKSFSWLRGRDSRRAEGHRVRRRRILGSELEIWILRSLQLGVHPDNSTVRLDIALRPQKTHNASGVNYCWLRGTERSDRILCLKNGRKTRPWDLLWRHPIGRRSCLQALSQHSTLSSSGRPDSHTCCQAIMKANVRVHRASRVHAIARLAADRLRAECGDESEKELKTTRAAREPRSQRPVGSAHLLSCGNLGRPGEQPSCELPQVVSLFSGAGGLDWGFHKEGFAIPLAIDSSAAAIRSHCWNFPQTNGIAADLTALGPKGVLALVKVSIPSGSAIGVIGGPPCQGFSRANTTAKHRDPRNKLSILYLDVVQHLKREYVVNFVVFENVLGIRNKKHATRYRLIKEGLESLDLEIAERELSALDFGVPQSRRRIVLVGLRTGQGYKTVNVEKREGLATVRAAIGGLTKPTFFRRNLKPSEIPIHPNHWTMNPKSARFNNGNSKGRDGRSFKRLSWHEPSPTIAYGHREIHVHPNVNAGLVSTKPCCFKGSLPPLS